MRFQNCMNFKICLLNLRAIQGHTGGNLKAPEVMGHVALFHTQGKNSCFIDYALMMSLQSSNQDLSLEDETAKEDRPSSSFTPLKPFGDNPDKEEPSDDPSKPRKVYFYSKWKILRDAVCWINLAEHKTKDYCVRRLYLQSDFQKSEGTLFERFSTPRPAPKSLNFKSTSDPKELHKM